MMSWSSGEARQVRSLQKQQWRKDFLRVLSKSDPPSGLPVRCAEGIGKEALHEFIDPDPCWISAEMTGASIVAPDGFLMKLESQLAGNKVGYILDRKIFDRELVWKAAEAGADVAVKTRASAPIMENGVVKGAKTGELRAGHERYCRCGYRC